MRILRRLHLVALLGVVPLIGCDALGLGKDPQVSLSFVAPGGLAAVQAASVLMDTLSGGGHKIDVQTVAVTFDRVVLERVHTDGPDDRADSDRDSDTDNADSDHAGNERARKSVG